MYDKHTGESFLKWEAFNILSKAKILFSVLEDNHHRYMFRDKPGWSDGKIVNMEEVGITDQKFIY